MLKHFAGEVTYAVANWLDKNNDKLSEDYEKHLKSSSKTLVKDHLTKKEEADGGPEKGRQTAWQAQGGADGVALPSVAQEATGRAREHRRALHPLHQAQ